MERQERKHDKQRPKILKDEGWLWNTYSWHGGVGRRRAVSNFTLIGKKNGMMDVIRGNMNEKKTKKNRKKKKRKATWVVWTKGENMHNSDVC